MKPRVHWSSFYKTWVLMGQASDRDYGLFWKFLSLNPNYPY